MPAEDDAGAGGVRVDEHVDHYWRSRANLRNGLPERVPEPLAIVDRPVAGQTLGAREHCKIGRWVVDALSDPAVRGRSFTL